VFGELKHRLYEIMEVPAYKNNRGWGYEFFMMALILANGIALIVGSVDWIQQQYGWFLIPFEIVSVLIFTAEYFILLWVCTENKHYKDPIRGRLKYAVTPIALINLISILPVLFPLVLPHDLQSLRLLRLFRMFRLLKLTKYSDSLKTLMKAVDSRKEQLIMTLIITAFLVVIAATFMYYAESGENPSPAFSDIPHTIWWSFVKISPISEEPGNPVTTTGKMIMSLLAIIEIGIFAIPAGIMASAFDEQWKSDRDHKEKLLKECETKIHNLRMVSCPHCSTQIDLDAASIGK